MSGERLEEIGWKELLQAVIDRSWGLTSNPLEAKERERAITGELARRLGEWERGKAQGPIEHYVDGFSDGVDHALSVEAGEEKQAGTAFRVATESSLTCDCACGHVNGEPCWVCRNQHLFIQQQEGK